MGWSFCSALGLYLLGHILAHKLCFGDATTKAPTSHLAVLVERLNIWVSAFWWVVWSLLHFYSFPLSSSNYILYLSFLDKLCNHFMCLKTLWWHFVLKSLNLWNKLWESWGSKECKCSIQETAVLSTDIIGLNIQCSFNTNKFDETKHIKTGYKYICRQWDLICRHHIPAYITATVGFPRHRAGTLNSGPRDRDFLSLKSIPCLIHLLWINGADHWVFWT